MTDMAASFYGDVTPRDRHSSLLAKYRRPARIFRVITDGIIIGVGTVGAAGLLVGIVTASAAWMLSTALSTNPHLQSQVAAGPATLALVRQAARMTAATDLSIPTAERTDVAEVPAETFDSIWSRTTASAPARDALENADRHRPAQVAAVAPAAAPWPAASPLAPPQQAPPERGDDVPLPRPNPARDSAGTQVAVAAPPPVSAPENHAAPQPAHNKGPALLDPDGRTAVYDISARTVYLPNGKKLEAHSGLGDKMDDPRYVHVKMRGATPPNVYELKLREQLFHGVQAIRLNPVDDGKMYGRNGILAHTYMLGPNGQSNGCVSFKDYRAFLNAYLKGEFNRLVVVPHLGDTPTLTAKAGFFSGSQYAASVPAGPRNFTPQ